MKRTAAALSTALVVLLGGAVMTTITDAPAGHLNTTFLRVCTNC